MKRPSFQFYPGDWRSNAKLRRCSPAARGVWMDVMCLLHDSDEYGLVRWPLSEIALAAGAAPAHVRELVSKGVLKGGDKELAEPFVYTPRSGRKDGEPVTLIPTQAGPIWFSSRMVKDEYVRAIRGQSTRFGEGEDASPKASPKGGFGDGSSSSSSPSGKNVPDGTGGKPPLPANDHPLKALFDTGVQILTSAGQSEKNARSIMGQLRKAKGDEGAAQVLALAAKASDPVTYIQRVIRDGKAADKPRPQASDWDKIPLFFDEPTPAKVG